MADTTGVDPNAPQPAGATPEQAAAAIANATAKPADAPGGSQSPTVDWGTVVSYGFPSASQQYPSLSIKVGGGTNTGVKYYGYTPRIGDWIMLLRSGRDIWVPGSRPPIGTLVFSDVSLSDPVLLLCNGAAVPVGYPNLARVPNFTDLSPIGVGGIVSTVGNTAGASTSSALVAHTHSHTHSHSTQHGYNQPASANSVTSGSSGGGVSAQAGSTTGGTLSTDTTGAGSGSSFSIVHPVRGVLVYVVAI